MKHLFDDVINESDISSGGLILRSTFNLQNGGKKTVEQILMFKTENKL